MPHRYMGEPDGATEDLNAYISVGNKIHFDFSRLDTSILVGRKGSGKSLCMRKFQDASEQHHERFCIRFRNKNPSYTPLIRFSTSIPLNERTMAWQPIWEYAILLSVATMLVFSDKQHSRYIQNIDTYDIDSFKNDFGDFFLGLTEVTHPYDIVNVFINNMDEHTESCHFLTSSQFINFRNRLLRIIRNSSTFCFFLDALDEELRRAPSLLIDITRGLFYTVMHMKRDNAFSNKIHVTIAIRDIVFSSIRQSEHYDRYVDTSYIAPLPWDAPLLGQFAARKIQSTVQRLGEADPKWRAFKGDSLAALLGFDTVINNEKGTQEDVLTYFIRHTNYVPRHLIRLGNKLFHQLDTSGRVDIRDFKQIVHEISCDIADQLVRVASAYLVSFSQGDYLAYLLKTQDDFATFCDQHTRIRPDKLEPYIKITQTTITDGFVRPIVDFIKHIGKDVFLPKELDEALAIFTTETVDYHNGIENHELNRLENILWSQGLIGVRNNVSGKDVDTFYYFSGIGGFGTLPAAVDKYVFFPGLVYLCHLRVEPGTPVGGNL